MDPITSGIISGLVVNALSKLARPLASSIHSHQDFTGLPDYGPLVLSLAAAMESTNLTEYEKQKVADFNRTDLAATIMRSLLVAKFTDETDRHNDDLKAGLSAALSFYAGFKPSSAETASELLFAVYSRACQSVWESIKNKDQRRQVTDAAWREHTAGQLANLPAARSAYSRRTPEELAAYREFELRLRPQIQERHQFIEPPDLDRKVEVPFDELYVSQGLRRIEVVNAGASSPTQQHGRQQADPRLVEESIGDIYRDVVVGDPGAGKSTLGMKLVNYLSKSADHNHTPFIIVLRDYGRFKHTRLSSIIDFIEMTVNATYQIRPPGGAIEYLLHNGRLVIIFDGLDELLDTSDRRDISSDVESFANLFPNVPILVTSRRVGYEQAPLNHRVFALHQLQPMTNDQVEAYASRWFALRATPEIARELTDSFIIDSEEVADIRSNSLMLGLLCNLYRTHRHIPRNRADVYRACATMLFVRWDQSRGISVDLPFRAHIDSAIKYLAFWIYSSPDRQSGVKENKLIETVAQFLLERRYDDFDEAVSAASQFVEFCRGRAWILTDVGTTEHENIYQFTHRTFLEYFAAAHIARTNPSPQALWALLGQKLVREEWTMVSQLALQLQEENIEGFADEFLRLLLDAANNSIEQSDPLIGFAIRCLSGVTPRRSIVREIAKRSYTRPNVAEELESVSHDNLTAIKQGLMVSITEIWQATKRDDNKLIYACRFLLGLGALPPTYREGARDFEHNKFPLASIASEAWNAIPALAHASSIDVISAVLAADCGLLNVRDILNRHGIASLLVPQLMSPYPNVGYYSPLAITLLAELFGLSRRVVLSHEPRSVIVDTIAQFCRNQGWEALQIRSNPEEFRTKIGRFSGIDLLSENTVQINTARIAQMHRSEQYVTMFLLSLVVDCQVYAEAYTDEDDEFYEEPIIEEPIDLDREVVANLAVAANSLDEADRRELDWWLAGNVLVDLDTNYNRSPPEAI